VIIDQLNQIWSGILQFSTQFITPDWGGLVVLIPILVLIGVVGPIVTILALAWLRYGAVRPRRKASFAEARRPAPLDAAGNPVYPAGEPYSAAEGMVYEPGTTRSASGDELVVACPKCGLVRSAVRDTCGNCGLSFTLKPTTRSLRPAGPPPGGAAAA
jgi:hypothetical protein